VAEAPEEPGVQPAAATTGEAAVAEAPEEPGVQPAAATVGEATAEALEKPDPQVFCGDEADDKEVSLQVAALLQQRHSELVRSVDLWLRHEEELVQNLLEAVSGRSSAKGSLASWQPPQVRPHPLMPVSDEVCSDEATESTSSPCRRWRSKKWNKQRLTRGSTRTTIGAGRRKASQLAVHPKAASQVSEQSAPARTSWWEVPLRRISSLYREKFGRQDEPEEDAPRSRLQEFVDSNFFAVAVFLVILTNVLVVGVETDYNAGGLTGSIPEDHEVFNTVHVVYTALFTVELLVRVLAEGCSFFYSGNWLWNWFEILIVALSVMDVILSNLNNEGESVFGKGKNWMIRLFRIVRMMRTLRIVRVVSFIREVCVVIQSITTTLRSLVWSMLLMLVILYGFGIVFTQAVTDYRTEVEAESVDVDEKMMEQIIKYWGTLPRSVLALFQAVTGGVSWSEVLDPLGWVSWSLVALFLAFFVLTFFALLNVMTAVFCQNAIESASADKELASMQLLANKHQWTEEMRDVFKKIDSNQSGEVDAEEFEMSLADERMQAFLACRGIDVHDAWTLFRLLDGDQRGVIEIDVFVDGLLQLRGPARAMQIAKVLQDAKLMRHEMEDFMEFISDGLERLLARMPVLAAAAPLPREAGGGARAHGGQRTSGGGSRCAPAYEPPLAAAPCCGPETTKGAEAGWPDEREQG